MAATGSYPNAFSAATRPSEGQGRPMSTPVFPNVEGLRTRARESITVSKWTSIDTLLAEASQANIHVTTSIAFGRPDRAYFEWLRCEEFIKLLMQSPAFNDVSEDKRRKVVGVQRTHEEQRDKIREIEATLSAKTLQEASAGNSVPGQSIPRKSVDSDIAAGQNGSQLSNRYTYSGAPPANGAQTANSGYVRQQGDRSSTFREDINGIPLQLRSRTLDDPLMARFSQLRGANMKDASAGPFRTSVPESLLPARPTTLAETNGSNGMAKPSGPRMMPNKDFNKDLPSTPPQLSTRALLDSLPRTPSPIYSPAAVNQNPGVTPPRQSSMGLTNGRAPPRPLREKQPFPELQDPNAIECEQLFDLMKTFKLLLIDVRSREAFDEGHIHAKNIVCVEPIALKPGQSLDQLEETLLYAPDDEVTNFRRSAEFDLVVFYDQKTSNGRFLSGAPAKDRSPHLRYLFDALTEFNYGQSLQRPPAYLVGGLDSWIDLVSVNALQTSNTAPGSTEPKPQRRRTTRASIIGANSSREIRAQRLAAYDPLNADEERQWLEKARKEELAPADIRQFAKQTDGDSISSQAEDELFLPIQNVDDFFRRYPDPSQIRQSMTSVPARAAPVNNPFISGPSGRQPSFPSQYAPPTAPPPPLSIPARPPPAASRPSYSGVSDYRATSQADAQARIAKPRPIYQSRSLAHTLKLPRTGLKNFGVTCYMNSTIQCLNATIPLSRFFLEETWRQFVRKNWKGSNGIMPEIFANLIRGLWRNESASLRPSSFRTFCNRLNSDWGNEQQQDSKEFLEFLIDTLHEDFNDNFSRNPLRPLNEAEEAHREELGRRQMNRVSKREWDRYTHRERSYISSLFAGQHASQLRCTTCQKTSTTYEAFYSISVEIPRTGQGDIRQCLESYCKEEQLSGNEEWRCPSCRCTRVATKRIMITRLPQILVIHFKRFSASRTESARKVHTPIDFPLHALDMQPYMADTYIEPGPDEYVDPAITPPFRYDCYAVMRHIGQTGNAGHYTAMCRDAARGCWREYNDDYITDIDPSRLRPNDRLQNQQAYILFYERAAPR